MKQAFGTPELMITAEVVNELRTNHLAPLDSPSKAEQVEELDLLAALSVIIDLVAQGWTISKTEPAVMLDFSNGLSAETEKERIRRAHLVSATFS